MRFEGGMTKNFTPLISIILPTNAADLELRRCIDSIRILMPSHNICEIVIVTTKSCHDVITETYIAEKVILEAGKGIYAAMNEGVRKSTGDYLYFIGKDDILLPAVLEAIDIIKSNQPKILCFDVYYGSTGNYSGRPILLKLLVKNLCHQGLIYSREIFKKHGPYTKSMKVQADHYLNIKILSALQKKDIYYSNKPIAIYSNTGFSNVNRDKLFRSLFPLILKKYVGKWAFWLILIARFIKRV